MAKHNVMFRVHIAKGPLTEHPEGQFPLSTLVQGKKKPNPFSTPVYLQTSEIPGTVTFKSSYDTGTVTFKSSYAVQNIKFALLISADATAKGPSVLPDVCLLPRKNREASDHDSWFNDSHGVAFLNECCQADLGCGCIKSCQCSAFKLIQAASDPSSTGQVSAWPATLCPLHTAQRGYDLSLMHRLEYVAFCHIEEFTKKNEASLKAEVDEAIEKKKAGERETI
ncbi:hypothetical protein P7K49_006479 [Saguinus oedipus]|uniref:Uncharacterized protein n=1 Tax=Saguinus oedipus TaxID=9490 RepID=A0ABQ9W4Z0_SAGOE|nr:hypothetical protein P7K49_006479 [Saguinus oedipus]